MSPAGHRTLRFAEGVRCRLGAAEWRGEVDGMCECVAAAAKAASDCGAICGRAGVNVQGTPPGACPCAAAISQGY